MREGYRKYVKQREEKWNENKEENGRKEETRETKKIK